jgi:hypothetical protein
MWIVGLSGIVFIVAGCMILLRQHDRMVDVLAAFICFCFAVTGAWVSLFSPPDGFSGGILFVSEELNIIFASVAFGIGTIATSLMYICNPSSFSMNMEHKQITSSE